MNEGASAARGVTRVLFQDFPHWMVASFYLVAILAVSCFLYGVYAHIRKYRRGAKLEFSWKSGFQRLGDTVKMALTHRSVKRRARDAGIAHAAIFYGFVLLFIGTATVTLDYDILGPLFGVHFWYGEFYLAFKLVMNIAGLGLLGGLVYMMIRRGWIKPPRLDYARPDRSPTDQDYDRSFYRIEDWAFLWLLVLIGATGYVVSASRLVWLADDATVWDHRWWSPVAAFIATGLHEAGMSADQAGTLRVGLWWFHGLMALGFIALIPYTKAQHIVTVLLSWFLRDPMAHRRLPSVDINSGKLGWSAITDFTSKHLIQLDACTKCGRCHEACPANAAGYPLSPRDVVLSLREFAEAKLGGISCGSDLIAIGEGLNQVRPETLWACRQCGACTEICPVGVEHVPMIAEMRRSLVDAGEMDELLQNTLQAIQKTGNSFNESRRKRMRWTRDLGFEVKDARTEPVDVLWFVGDYASFDPRSQKTSQSFARILHAAGVDFGILHEGETTAGNDVRRVGEEGLFQFLATGNAETLAAASFKSIVTTDPHSFNTLKNEYPEFGADYPVEHASTLIERLIAEGKLTLTQKLGTKIAYHDPCHLGRLNKVFDAPRTVLVQAGAEIVELERNRDNSFCCGGGGGRVWIPDAAGQKRPGESRVREAAEIDGLDVLAVACPKCMTMLEDATKTAGLEGRYKVMDLIELVALAMTPEPVEEAVL